MHGNPALFVGEGVDGIFVGGLEGGVERSKDGSDKGGEGGFPDNEGSQRTMDEIADNQFVHESTSV